MLTKEGCVLNTSEIYRLAELEEMVLVKGTLTYTDGRVEERCSIIASSI